MKKGKLLVLSLVSLGMLASCQLGANSTSSSQADSSSSS
jgi:hypothetical protein